MKYGNIIRIKGILFVLLYILVFLPLKEKNHGFALYKKRQIKLLTRQIRYCIHLLYP